MNNTYDVYEMAKQRGKEEALFQIHKSNEQGRSRNFKRIMFFLFAFLGCVATSILTKESHYELSQIMILSSLILFFLFFFSLFHHDVYMEDNCRI